MQYIFSIFCLFSAKFELNLSHDISGSPTQISSESIVGDRTFFKHCFYSTFIGYPAGRPRGATGAGHPAIRGCTSVAARRESAERALKLIVGRRTALGIKGIAAAIG